MHRPRVGHGRHSIYLSVPDLHLNTDHLPLQAFTLPDSEASHHILTSLSILSIGWKLLPDPVPACLIAGIAVRSPDCSSVLIKCGSRLVACKIAASNGPTWRHLDQTERISESTDFGHLPLTCNLIVVPHPPQCPRWRGSSVPCTTANFRMLAVYAPTAIQVDVKRYKRRLLIQRLGLQNSDTFHIRLTPAYIYPQPCLTRDARVTAQALRAAGGPHQVLPQITVIDVVDLHVPRPLHGKWGSL
mmetsp:Transcript_108221/g.258294  ORF Transcript_108221/g.258294 Transcript_108221/m.258294 type:complete len:244 (-) Transcript_108221:208-939(-)